LKEVSQVTVHKNCRREYTHPGYVKSTVKETEGKTRLPAEAKSRETSVKCAPDGESVCVIEQCINLLILLVAYNPADKSINVKPTRKSTNKTGREVFPIPQSGLEDNVHKYI